MHYSVPLQANMKDSVIILSGGMDSVTLLYDQQERIALAVSFDYGSNHNAREIPFAQLHCKRLGIEHLVIPLQFMGQYFESSLLQGADAIPEGHYAADNMKSTVVPFRNGIMLSVAIGLAESRGLQHVMMANHGGDHTIYPDCRPEFVEAMSEAARTGTYPGITLLCPRTKTNGVGHSQLQGKKRTFNLNFVHLLALLIGKCVILQAILNSNKN